MDQSPIADSSAGAEIDTSGGEKLAQQLSRN
jgi:hypothetical protein